MLCAVLGAVLGRVLYAVLCYAVLYRTVVYCVYLWCRDVMNCGRVRYMMYYGLICPRHGLGDIY